MYRPLLPFLAALSLISCGDAPADGAQGFDFDDTAAWEPGAAPVAGEGSDDTPASSSGTPGSPAGTVAGGGKLTLHDATLGMPAMTVTVPKGYRAEGQMASKPGGGGLQDFLLVASGEGGRQLVMMNIVSAQDPAAVFGGQRADLAGALQRQCGELAVYNLQRLGLRVTKAPAAWQTLSRNEKTTTYAAEVALADGREGVVVLPVPSQSLDPQRGFATSAHPMVMLAPGTLSEAEQEEVFAAAVALDNSLRENPAWAEATWAATNRTIASRNQQSSDFNAQMRRNHESFQRSHQQVVDAQRSANAAHWRGVESRSAGMSQTSDVLSGHGRYVDPYTGRETLVGDDIGSGGQTYINQSGEVFQTDDVNFDPYVLPEGYRRARKYNYYRDQE